MKVIGVKVDSIHCEKCVARITNALMKDGNVIDVKAILPDRLIILSRDSLERGQVVKILERLGFKVVG